MVDQVKEKGVSVSGEKYDLSGYGKTASEDIQMLREPKLTLDEQNDIAGMFAELADHRHMKKATERLDLIYDVVGGDFPADALESYQRHAKEFLLGHPGELITTDVDLQIGRDMQKDGDFSIEDIVEGIQKGSPQVVFKNVDAYGEMMLGGLEDHNRDIDYRKLYDRTVERLDDDLFDDVPMEKMKEAMAVEAARVLVREGVGLGDVQKVIGESSWGKDNVGVSNEIAVRVAIEGFELGAKTDVTESLTAEYNRHNFSFHKAHPEALNLHIGGFRDLDVKIASLLFVEGRKHDEIKFALDISSPNCSRVSEIRNEYLHGVMGAAYEKVVGKDYETFLKENKLEKESYNASLNLMREHYPRDPMGYSNPVNYQKFLDDKIADDLLGKGALLSDVQKILGHSQSANDTVYGKGDPEYAKVLSVEAAIRKFEPVRQIEARELPKVAFDRHFKDFHKMYPEAVNIVSDYGFKELDVKIAMAMFAEGYDGQRVRDGVEMRFGFDVEGPYVEDVARQAELNLGRGVLSVNKQIANSEKEFVVPLAVLDKDLATEEYKMHVAMCLDDLKVGQKFGVFEDGKIAVDMLLVGHEPLILKSVIAENTSIEMDSKGSYANRLVDRSSNVVYALNQIKDFEGPVSDDMRFLSDTYRSIAKGFIADKSETGRESSLDVRVAERMLGDGMDRRDVLQAIREASPMYEQVGRDLKKYEEFLEEMVVKIEKGLKIEKNHGEVSVGKKIEVQEVAILRIDYWEGYENEKRFDSFEKASEYLKDYAKNMPSDRSSEECDFKVTWKDGHTYEGQYDLKPNAANEKNHLEVHMRDFAEASAGLRKPLGMSEEDYLNYNKMMESVTPGYTQSFVDFLDKYELRDVLIEKDVVVSKETKAIDDVLKFVNEARESSVTKEMLVETVTKGQSYDPDVVFTLQRLGVDQVPGLRLGDAETAGKMFVMLEAKMIDRGVWDKHVGDLEKMGAIRKVREQNLAGRIENDGFSAIFPPGMEPKTAEDKKLLNDALEAIVAHHEANKLEKNTGISVSADVRSPVKEIRIERREGRFDEGRLREIVTKSFDEANAFLKEMAKTAPNCGYDKCSLTVTWENGKQYDTRYDLEQLDRLKVDLIQTDIKRDYEFAAGIYRPSHLKEEDWQGHLDRIVPEEKERCIAFLKGCEGLEFESKGIMNAKSPSEAMEKFVPERLLMNRDPLSYDDPNEFSHSPKEAYERHLERFATEFAGVGNVVDKRRFKDFDLKVAQVMMEDGARPIDVQRCVNGQSPFVDDSDYGHIIAKEVYRKVEVGKSYSEYVQKEVEKEFEPVLRDVGKEAESYHNRDKDMAVEIFKMHVSSDFRGKYHPRVYPDVEVSREIHVKIAGAMIEEGFGKEELVRGLNAFNYSPTAKDIKYANEVAGIAQTKDFYAKGKNDTEVSELLASEQYSKAKVADLVREYSPVSAFYRENRSMDHDNDKDVIKGMIGKGFEEKDIVRTVKDLSRVGSDESGPGTKRAKELFKAAKAELGVDAEKSHGKGQMVSRGF